MHRVAVVVGVERFSVTLASLLPRLFRVFLSLSLPLRSEPVHMYVNNVNCVVQQTVSTGQNDKRYKELSQSAYLYL